MRNFNTIAAAALLALAQFGCTNDGSMTITQYDPDAGRTHIVCVAPGWTVIGWNPDTATPTVRRETPAAPRVYAAGLSRFLVEAGADPRCSQPEALDAGK